jgi:hypothetical protein
MHCTSMWRKHRGRNCCEFIWSLHSFRALKFKWEIQYNMHRRVLVQSSSRDVKDVSSSAPSPSQNIQSTLITAIYRFITFRDGQDQNRNHFLFTQKYVPTLSCTLEVKCNATVACRQLTASCCSLYICDFKLIEERVKEYTVRSTCTENIGLGSSAS